MKEKPGLAKFHSDHQQMCEQCRNCEAELTKLREAVRGVLDADDAVHASAGRLRIEARMQKVEAQDRLRQLIEKKP